MGLLQRDDPAPFEVVRPQARSRFVINCDHAGRVLPRALELGVDASELERHIAYDLGAAELGRALAARIDAFLILQTYSRLVIDVNRPPGSPDSIVTVSERTAIPGNVGLTDAQREERERAIFWPYHERITAELDRRAALGEATVLVALHSFTPSYKDEARRWHAGILHGPGARIGEPMLAYLRREPELVVGDNEPYSLGEDTDYAAIVHGARRGLPYVELEVRQDLIADDAGRDAWCERIAGALEHAVSTLLPA